MMRFARVSCEKQPPRSRRQRATGLPTSIRHSIGDDSGCCKINGCPNGRAKLNCWHWVEPSCSPHPPECPIHALADTLSGELPADNPLAWNPSRSNSSARASIVVCRCVKCPAASARQCLSLVDKQYLCRPGGRAVRSVVCVNEKMSPSCAVVGKTGPEPT